MNPNQTIYYKKLLVIALVILAGLAMTGCVFKGLIPQFTYQGVLADENGNPYNGDVTIIYKLFDDPDGGTALFEQTRNVTVTDGRFNSVVGPGIVAEATGLSPQDFSRALWIELTVGNGVITETLTPRQRLYGAHYALTLIPGTVISGTMGSVQSALGIEGIVSIYNMDTTADALPALRAVGRKGLEVAGAPSADGSGFSGRIYGDLAHKDSDLQVFSNDEIWFYLDRDNDSTSEFRVYGGDGTAACRIQEDGDLYCTGNIHADGDLEADGNKPAIVTVGDEQRYLYAVESPEVWFEDFGSGSLDNGAVTITIDPLFAQTINLDEEYHVFVTPLGDCNGLYVTNKTDTGFEVHELGGGTSSVSFDYRIVAKRLGYEDLRMEIHTSDTGEEE
jgi:hypothetical protein